jgi:ABC-2 type transport system permease protein
MRKILNIAINDLRVAFSDRSIWVFSVVMPVVLIVIVAFANGAFQTAPERARQIIDVVGLEPGTTLDLLTGSIHDVDAAFIVCPPDAAGDSDPCQLDGAALTPELAEERLTARRTLATLILPADFGASVMAGQQVTAVYRSNEDATQSSAAFSAVSAAMQRLEGAEIARSFAQRIADASLDGDQELVDGVYERASAAWQENPVEVVLVDASIERDPAAQAPGFRQSVPGMGSMYVLFTAFAATVVLLDERKRWTLQRLMTTPITRAQYILGKTLAIFALAMFQFAVAFSAGMLLGSWAGTPIGGDPIGLLLVMLAFAFMAAAITLLLATLVKTEQQANAITTLLALTLAPIGGAWWSLQMEFIPDFMRQISYLSPIRYAMDAFSKLINEGASWTGVLPEIGILLAIGAVVYGIAVVRFKYE